MFPLPELFWFVPVLKFWSWSCYKYIFLKKLLVRNRWCYIFDFAKPLAKLNPNKWGKWNNTQMNHFWTYDPESQNEISHLFSLFFLRRYFPEKTSTIIVSNLHKFFWVLSGIVDFFVTILMKLLNTNPQFSLRLFLYIGLINYADRSYVVPL